MNDKWATPKKLGIYLFYFFIKFRWNLSSPKLEGSHEAIWGDFPFFMEQATCALISSSFKSIWWSCGQLSPCPKGKTPPKLGIKCERYRLLNLTLTFEQHMEPPPKTSNAKLTKKNPTCLEYEVFICYFGPHGSIPKEIPSIYTNHPNIRWWLVSSCMST